ncbi:MAG: DoxX family membrane protein [Opitutaceae bacterium]
MSQQPLPKVTTTISWICQVLAAVILFQTLFFKFSGAEESVYIFETVGLEPFGRYASGVAELIAGILLLTPRFSWVGAGLAVSIMSGAIISHLTVIGIEVMGDGGTLFSLALIVTVTSAVVLFLRRHTPLALLNTFKK